MILFLLLACDTTQPCTGSLTNVDFSTHVDCGRDGIAQFVTINNETWVQCSCPASLPPSPSAGPIASEDDEWDHR